MPSSLLKRYILVGGTSFCIEIVALYVLKNIIKLSPESSVAISFWIGFVCGFILQKHVTYKNKHKAPHLLARQLVMYAALVLFNYIFTIAAVNIFKQHMSVFIIRTAVVLVTTSWNFFAYKLIFKHTRPEMELP